MKKFMMFAALAAVPFLFNSCKSTSQEDVIYEIGITVDGSSSFSGTDAGDAYELYNEIKSTLSMDKEQWTETVIDGDSSAADAKAIAKYDAVEAQIKAKVTEYQTRINALEDNRCLFTFNDKLYLRKLAIGGVDKDLKSYHISLSNVK